MNLTYRQFEILVAAADCETFSAAALRLGVSQPSLSESIRRIEQEIGTEVRRLRKSLDLTVTELGAAAGISAGMTRSRVEPSRLSPRMAATVRLAGIESTISGERESRDAEACGSMSAMQTLSPRLAIEPASPNSKVDRPTPPILRQHFSRRPFPCHAPSRLRRRAIA